MKKYDLKHDKINDSVILCCGGVRKCPELFNLDDGNIKIKDDFGSSVVITKDQAKMIAEAVQLIEDSDD